MEKELEEEPSRVQGPERESNFLFFNTAPENKLGERSSVPRFVLSGKEKVEETREKIAELFGLAKKPKKNGSKGIAGESEEKDEEKSEVEEEGLSQQNQNYYFLAYSIIDSLKFVAESREGKILVDYFRDPDSGKLEEAATILAKANFDVEILRGNGTLGGDSDGFFSRKISALCEKLEENYRVPDNSDETGDQKKEKTTIEPSHIATVPPGGAEDLSGSSRKKLNRECLEKKLAADMAKLFGAEVNGTTTIRAESRDGNALIYSMAGLDGAAQDSRVELFDENTFSAMEKLPERCLADGKNITGGAAKDSAIGNLAGTLVALSYLNDKDGIGSGGQNIALVDGNIVLNGLGESFRSGDNLGSNLIPQRLGGPRASLAESFYYTENSRPPWFLRPFENFLTKRAARFNNFNNYSVFEDVSLVDQLRQLQKLRKNVFAGDALENLKSSYLAAYASVDSGFSEKERKNFSKVIGDKFKFIEKRNTYIDKTFGDRLAVLEKEGGEKALETCEMIQGMIFRAKANPNLSSNISVEKTKSYVNVAFSESTGKFEFSLENVSLLPFLDRDRKKKFKELMAKLEDAEGFSRTSSKKFTVAGDGIEKFGKTIGEFFEKHKNNLLESDPLAEKHVKLKELLRQNKSEGLEEQLKHSENIIEQLSEYAKEHDRKMDGLRKNSGREAKAANFKYPRSLSEIEIKKIAESEERRETEKGLKWFERLWVNELRRKRGLEGELSKSKELSEDIEQQVTKPEKPGEEKEEKEGEEKEGEEKEGEEKEEKEEQEEEEEEKSEEEERETTMGLRRVEEIEEKKKRPEEVKRKMEEGEEEPAPKSQEEINESIMAVATLYQQIAENFHSAEASAKHYAATDQIFDLQKKLAESIIAGHGKAKYFGDYSENPQKYAPLFGKENVLTSGGEDVVIDIEQLKKSLTRNEKPDAAVGEEDGGIAPSLQEIIDRLAQVAMAVARRQYNEIHCGGPRGEVAGEEAKAEGSAKDFDTAYFESIEQAEYEVETTLLGRLGEAEEKSDLSGEKTENDPFVKDRSLCDTLCGAEKTRLAAKKRSELAQKRSREVATEGTGERVGEETKSVSVADAGRGVPYREISEAYREAIKKHSNSINFESFGDTRNAIGDSRTLSFKKNDVDFSLKLPEQAANNWDFFKMNRYINKNSGFMVGLLRYVENSPELGIGPSELPDMIETSYGSEDRTLQNDEKMSKLELALVHLGPEDENGKPKVDQLFRNRKCEDLIRKAFAMEDGSKLFSLAKDKARTAKDKFVGISSVRAK